MSFYPPLSISLQDAFCLTTDLSRSYFNNNSIVAGASACSATALTEAAFNAVTQSQISSTWTANLAGMGLTPAFTGFLILDIELPVSPQNWWAQDAAYFAAVKLRVDTIAALMPAAKIGLYATSYQPYMGDLVTIFGDGTSWAQTCSGYALAEAAGVFQNVGYLCPLAAALWDLDDTPTHLATVNKSTFAAMSFSQTFGKPLVPMLRFKIYNSASVDNGRTTQSLQSQIQSLLPFTPEAIVFWAALESDVVLSVLPPPLSFGSSMNPYNVTFAVPAAWGALSATSLMFIGTITALAANGATVQIRRKSVPSQVDAQSLVPMGYVPYPTLVDLADIQVQDGVGTTTIMIAGSTCPLSAPLSNVN